MRSQCLFACVVLACATLSTTTIAQPAAPRARENAAAAKTARVLALANAYEAEKFVKAEQWDEAFNAFSEANALVHSPMFVKRMADCKRKIGALAVAYKLYKSVINEQLPLGATKEYENRQKEAQENAMEEVEKLKPTLQIIVERANGRALHVTIDGWLQPSIAEPIKVEPGKHEIEFALDRGNSAFRIVDVAEGEAREVRVALPLDPPKLPKAILLPAVKEQKKPTSSEKAINFAVGVSAVGMPLGLVMAIAGFVVNDCANQAFAPESAGSCAMTQDQARKWDPISTKLAATGAVTFFAAPIVSVLIVAVGAGHRSKPDPQPARTSILPVITPSGVFLTGTF